MASSLPVPNTNTPPGFKTPQMLLEESFQAGDDYTPAEEASTQPVISIPGRRQSSVPTEAPLPFPEGKSRLTQLYLDTPVLEIPLGVQDYGMNGNIVMCILPSVNVPSFKPSLYTQLLSLRLPDETTLPVYLAGPSFKLQGSGNSVLSFFIDLPEEPTSD